MPTTAATRTARKPTPKPGADQKTRDVAEMFKLASDPTRLRVILILAGGERNVGDLAGALGLSQPALSHQLRALRLTRIVAVVRRGKCSFYALTDAGRGIERAARGMGA